MGKLRFPKSVLRERLSKFQELLMREGIDAVMIRVKSSFTYFTGTRWLRPALLIPANDEPTLFAVKGEEDELVSRTWINNVVTFRDAGELMGKVSSFIRRRNYRVVGLEFGVEADAYILFYEMFKRLNPGVKVVDVSELIHELRMVKDEYELSAIKEAGRLAKEVLRRVEDAISIGKSETELASEVYYQALKLGSEEPKVYVNIGPNPRVHASPFRDVRVVEGVATTVALGIDYNGYYVNVSRTYLVGSSELGEVAIECAKEVYELGRELTRAGVKPADVMKELDKVYGKYGLINERVVGYLHGVGLQVEEPPITTIVPKHRFLSIREGMVVALNHAPLMIKGLGQVKFEDTFLVTRDGLKLIT